MRKALFLCVSCLIPLTAMGAVADDAPSPWRPVAAPLMTRWAKDVSPRNVLPEYPRPQLVRQQWQNLNGLWQFAIGQQGESVPTGKVLPRQILVPFAMESALSGIRQTAEFVWYRRPFELPAAWKGQHILLHFGAVDWEATVYVNGRQLGSHRGGYDPFTLDITDALSPTGPQELIVAVSDPMQDQARGKQSRPIFQTPRRSIFYSCVTGIWQTVWLEPVPAASIADLCLVPDVDAGVLRLTVQGRGTGNDHVVEAIALSADRERARATGKPGQEIVLPIKDARLWSPDTPFLYDLKISLKRDQETLDSVTSYFAMRKIAIGKDERGITRMLLNGKFAFQMGSLDQGFWPDGIYTAPTDEALRFDIEFAKRIGLNLARKHVKVEPDRWYYWADKLGLLVWQDMPSFSPNADYDQEMPRVIASLRNHPCIVLWVMMNEGYPTGEQQEHATALARRCDPTRLVTAISGWRDMGFGDISDRHDYPGPSSPVPQASRAVVLGEWGKTDGGIPGHDWMEALTGDKCRPFACPNEKLDQRHEALLQRLWRYAYSPGLSGAAWTQLTDIEGETNGFITYDREIIKNTIERVAAANQGFVPPIALPDAGFVLQFKDALKDNLHGLFADSVDVQLINPRPDAVIRYTLDGSPPSAQSPRYVSPITLTATTTINAVAFWPNRPASAAASFLYRKVTDFQSGVSIADPRPGLNWQYLEDDRVIQTGVLDQFTFRPDDPYVKHPKEKSRFRWTGYVRVPRDGVYTFQRPANNMALSIGPTPLFTTNGGLGDREQTVQIPLKAGYHTIEASWLQSRNGYYSLDCPIHCEGPGVPLQPIPHDWLFQRPPTR